MECCRCGACCKTFPVFASKTDAEREPRIRSEAYELPAHLQNEDWAYKLHRLPFHERCVFLDEKNCCTIHPTRPDVCRNFAPGEKQCTEARGRVGLSALAEKSDSSPPSHKGTRNGT